MEYHLPILLSEVIRLLDPQPGKTYIDATLGNGGHTIKLLKTEATVYGFDQDPTNLRIATERIESLGLNKHFYPIHANFNQLSTVKQSVDGILFDLGLSKNQLKASNRGFSFNDLQSIDLRLDPSTDNLSGQEIVNTYSEDELFDIFSKYSQEKNSRIYARLITRNRPIISANQLANLVKEFAPKSKTNPATKILMALRIAVNQEFANLKLALKQTITQVKSGGTVCVLTFHSGEDRIVKQFINQNKVVNLSSKPIAPSHQEITANPLSRSAKLRAYRIK